jgi:hypothetical protein
MCMDGANLADYEEMLMVLKFVSDTKDFFLILNPSYDIEEWDLVSCSHRDLAGSPEKIISVTGFNKPYA